MRAALTSFNVTASGVSRVPPPSGPETYERHDSSVLGVERVEVLGEPLDTGRSGLLGEQIAAALHADRRSESPR